MVLERVLATPADFGVNVFIDFDTETFLIERALLAPPMVCCQFKIGHHAPEITHAKWAVPVLRDLLSSKEFLVGHNIAYDMAVICSTYPDLASLVWEKYERGEILDTMVAEMLIDIARGTYAINSEKAGWYTLEQTAARYGFEKHGDDPWRLRYGELYDLPVSEWPAEAVEYAKHDAVVPVQVLEKQLKHVEWLGDLENQCRAAFCLHLMSCWGVHTDPVKVEALRTDVNKLLDEVRQNLVKELLLVPKNKKEGNLFYTGRLDIKDVTWKRNTRLAQSMQWNEALRLGIEPKWTKGGLKLEPKDRQIKHLSLDEDAIDMIGLPILKDYSTWVTQNTLKARVEDLAEGYEYPLQARFDVLKETGRTSSKKPTGVLKGTQLQNMPVKLNVRECFKPREGMCFLGADYSSAELHTLAQACLDLFGESRLAEALNAGRDVHVQFASRILGIDYGTAYTRYKNNDPEVKACRDEEAKRCNFGLGGGMGWKRLQQTIWLYGKKQISDERAKLLVRLWRQEWPEMDRYFRYVNSLLGGRESVSVKALRADRVRGRVKYCEICNGFFQIPAADGIKRSLWLVAKASYAEPESPLYGFRPWNVVHDEIIGEAPINRVHTMAGEFQRLMELGINHYVPDVPTTAEPVAMMYYSKKAKAVYDSEGRLIPWNGTS